MNRTKSIIHAFVVCMTSFAGVTALSACARNSGFASIHAAAKACPTATADDDIPEVVIVARRVRAPT